MYLAVDVQYDETNKTAVVAGVIFSQWNSDEIIEELLVNVSHIKPYEPGEFYKRELPCILQLMETITIEIELIIVDGYVTLGSNIKPGLGMYLYDALEQKIGVIGVAKNKFMDTLTSSEVLRGISKKPLYVTSAGIDLEDAKSCVRKMHGEHRFPTLLKKVDALCRQA